MSVSLILVPAALAIAGIIGTAGAAGAASMSTDERTSSGGSGPTPIEVHTRMKDASLLASALQDLGASTVDAVDGALTAVVGDLSLRMTRDDDDIWTAHITGADGRDAQAADATALIEQIDAAYARRVQREVAARIRTRADDAGFELISESREEDDSVTMVLAVREQL